MGSLWHPVPVRYTGTYRCGTRRYDLRPVKRGRALKFRKFLWCKRVHFITGCQVICILRSPISYDPWDRSRVSTRDSTCRTWIAIDRCWILINLHFCINLTHTPYRYCTMDLDFNFRDEWPFFGHLKKAKRNRSIINIPLVYV